MRTHQLSLGFDVPLAPHQQLRLPIEAHHFDVPHVPGAPERWESAAVQRDALMSGAHTGGVTPENNPNFIAAQQSANNLRSAGSANEIRPRLFDKLGLRGEEYGPWANPAGGVVRSLVENAGYSADKGRITERALTYGGAGVGSLALAAALLNEDRNDRVTVVR